VALAVEPRLSVAMHWRVTVPKLPAGPLTLAVTVVEALVGELIEMPVRLELD
jgi:hypothetical protein